METMTMIGTGPGPRRIVFGLRRIVLGLAAAALLVGAPVATAQTANPTTAIIVELDGEPGAVWKARLEQGGAAVSDTALASYRADLRADQDAVLSRIRAAGVDFTPSAVTIPGLAGLAPTTVQHRFTLVLNAVTIHVPIDQVATVRGVDGVARIHRVRELRPTLDRSVAFTRANELYGGVAELTRFDDLREGYEGQGIVISVIDTGIEWHHEMFGGDPTPPRFGLAPHSTLVPTNEKIVYNLPLSDLAVEDGFGHGTHVASTAAGYLGFTAGGDGVPLTADDIPLHGVAPQARLMSYGVCSDIVSTPGALGVVALGGCFNVNTILALEDSVSPRSLTGFPKPVAHVINLSLGGNYGTPDDATAVAASNAALMGAIVVAAAGNAGDVPGIVGSPSTGRHVISVAAATDPGSGANWFADVLDASAFGPETTGAQSPADHFPTASGERTDIVLFPMAGTPTPPEGGLAQYFAYVADAPTAAHYPASVSGRIALVDNGALVGLFAEYANNAAAAGAVAVLLIGTTENATAVNAPIPAAVIKPEDAEYLLSLIGPEPQEGDVSGVPLRLGANQSSFRSEVAGFSSRGPVAGLGQIKPDLSAPGVNVLAAVPPASLIGAITATEQGVNYGAISGTSMATPHVAGIAAQIKQANPTWTPDVVRTALINHATPMRDGAGGADSFGDHNPRIVDQGGGLVDAADAARARAVMGVVGDGVDSPGILGSHSFGSVPVIGAQCVHEEQVEVTVRDLRGTGGVYQLALHDNRGMTATGVSASLSAQQVSVPPGGSATFTASLTFDGVEVQDGPPRDVQWFVTATRANGSETLSMPLFYRAVPSVPAGEGGVEIVTEIYDGTVGAGSTEAGFGQQYADVEVEVAGGVFRMTGLLEADEPTNAAYPDLDLELYDPNGNRVDSSGNIGSVESVDIQVAVAGTYVYRVVNYLSAGSSFTLTVEQHRGGDAAPATLAPVETEFTSESGEAIDFDGAFTLSWSGIGGETAYRVEQSVDGGAWTQIARVDAATTEHAVEGLEDGSYAFRIRSEFPGVICTYVEQPSEARAVVVEHREQVVVTSEVATPISRVHLENGVFEVDVALRNDGSTTILDPLELAIVGIDSSSSQIVVINADNGGGGTGLDDPALFGYADQVGGDELSPGESSAARTLRFADPDHQLFSFDVIVRGWVPRR